MNLIEEWGADIEPTYVVKSKVGKKTILTARNLRNAPVTRIIYQSKQMPIQTFDSYSYFCESEHHNIKTKSVIQKMLSVTSHVTSHAVISVRQQQLERFSN